MSRILSTACLAICLADAASASVINYLADVNAPGAVAGSITPTTTGASMAGQMTVSVNGGAAVPWTAPNVSGCMTAAECGFASAALGNGTWTLSVSGNPGAVTDPNNPQATALFPWTLTNTSTNIAITSVVLDGVLPGSCFVGNPNPAGCVPGVVFDRDRAAFNGTDSFGNEGTPGSNLGITYKFNFEIGGTFTANVTYSDVVLLAPSQPCNGAAFSGNNTINGCGDLWGQLAFAFSGSPFQAGATSAVWSFFQDTDNFSADGIAAVPEPSTMGLMGVALLALAALRRRRITGPAEVS